MEDDEIDPLDAFMNQVSETIQKENSMAKSIPYAPPEIVSGEDRDYDSYLSLQEANPESNAEIEYDSDGVPIKLKDKKAIEPLPVIDHSCITYPTFDKIFYKESVDIKSLSNEEITSYLKDLNITVEVQSSLIFTSIFS